jgi:aspartyl protease family protein
MKSYRAYGAFITLGVLALCLAVQAPTAAIGQGETDLLPRLGETTREYEARIKGLPRPAREETYSVTLAADPGGNFFVDASVNGTRLKMMVDTGASHVALSEKDARAAGIRVATSDFNSKSVTANGVVSVAPVLLRVVAIGDIALTNVQAIVIPEGRLAGSLLGMSFLSRLSRYEVYGGKLTLKR